VFWSTDTMNMSPLRDPIRNIVYYAQPTDIQSVLVDGEPVVEDGEVHGLDRYQVAAGVQAVGELVWKQWQEVDWAGRTVEQHFPLSYPAARD
jgi:5-methylthioadenosine/S-adenosylhomocysteine deaminase